VTTRTRRRLLFCCLVVAFTLPVESVLLQAVSTPDVKTAAIEWATSLSPEVFERVSADVANYPLYLRRAIMRAASPQRRSQVWRGHIASYVDTHPDLSASALELLNEASALASPENLSTADAAARARMKSVGDQLKALIGQEDVDNLLYRLGRRDGTFESHEPVSLQLSNWVRAKFTALAASFAADCDCNIGFGCDGLFVTCRDNTGCAPDEDWPACGWFWSETCDGVCKSVWVS